VRIFRERKNLLNRGKAAPLEKHQKNSLALKDQLNSEFDTLIFYESLTKLIDRNRHCASYELQVSSCHLYSKLIARNSRLYVRIYFYFTPGCFSTNPLLTFSASTIFFTSASNLGASYITPSLIVYFTPPTLTILLSSVSLMAPVPYKT
jgi:hypothetical protein